MLTLKYNLTPYLYLKNLFLCHTYEFFYPLLVLVFSEVMLDDIILEMLSYCNLLEILFQFSLI